MWLNFLFILYVLVDRSSLSIESTWYGEIYVKSFQDDIPFTNGKKYTHIKIVFKGKLKNKLNKEKGIKGKEVFKSFE